MSEREFIITPVIRDEQAHWRVDEQRLPHGEEFCFYTSSELEAGRLIHHLLKEPIIYVGSTRI